LSLFLAFQPYFAEFLLCCFLCCFIRNGRAEKQNENENDRHGYNKEAKRGTLNARVVDVRLKELAAGFEYNSVPVEIGKR
jgi:hypothetical protein